jgi:hypothetical protein
MTKTIKSKTIFIFNIIITSALQLLFILYKHTKYLFLSYDGYALVNLMSKNNLHNF